jgi:serine/threonine-protein kinase
MASPETDVFVSYKAEDRARLKPLVAALEAEGFSVWWDEQIGGGANWHKEIEQHLDAAKCVVVAWTKRSVGDEGHFVRDEARRAQKRQAYVPVCLDQVEPPLGFGEVQAISLKGWKGDASDARFKALADAIHQRIGEHVVQPAVSSTQLQIPRRVLIAGGAGVAVTAAAGVGAWALLRPSSAASASIAVLPFANLSGDPAQAYFSDGIADEIRSALTRLGGLTVIGSTSSEAVRHDDAKTAAQKLGVAHILTGSVRQSPSTIRVSAELIDGRSGADRWTQNYDRSPGDTIKIQTDIAENVATALKGALGLAARAAITLGGTADSTAQDLVLQARKLFRTSTSAEAYRQRLALAAAAVARDPNYADAYVEQAKALAVLADNNATSPAEAADNLAQADAAARKAVALAPKLGSAHAAVAIIAEARLDFASALQQAKVALALSPSDPTVLQIASQILAYFGRGDEGLDVIDRAIALDPFNGRDYDIKAGVLKLSRRYPQAIAAGRKALEFAPELRSTHIYVGDSFLLLGQTGQAKAEYEAIGADSPLRLERIALLAARTGDRAGAERMMARLKEQIGANASYRCGEIYAQLGDTGRAFAELDNAARATGSGLYLLKVDPFLDPIRADSRYAALLKRLNFP